VPGAEHVKTPRGTLIVDNKRRTEIHFLDERTFVFGPVGAVGKLLERARPARGNLSAALKLAASQKPVVVALNPQVLPAMAAQTVPPPFRPLLNARLATLSLDLGDESEITLALQYADADATAAAEEAVKDPRQIKLSVSVLPAGMDFVVPVTVKTMSFQVDCGHFFGADLSAFIILPSIEPCVNHESC